MGSLFYTISEAYVDAATGRERASYLPCVMPGYPECGDRLGYLVNDISRSGMADRQMSFQRVLMCCKLQS